MNYPEEELLGLRRGGDFDCQRIVIQSALEAEKIRKVECAREW